MAPTWCQLGVPNRSKIGPRAIQNPFKNLACFRCPCGSIFDGFGLNLRALNVQKLSSRLGVVHILHILVVCLLDGSWKPTWLDFGRVWGAKLKPKSVKNQSKKALKTRSNFDWILDGSWAPFAANLVRFGSNLASNLEVPAGPLEAHLLTLGGLVWLLEPRWRPEPPKSASKTDF